MNAAGAARPARAPSPLFSSVVSPDAPVSEISKHSQRLSGAHAFSKPFDGGLDATVAVRDIERFEAYFDHAERAKDHWGVDMAHVGDAESLACEFADPDAQHHAAFFLAVALQCDRIVAIGHHDGGHGVRP